VVFIDKSYFSDIVPEDFEGNIEILNSGKPIWNSNLQYERRNLYTLLTSVKSDLMIKTSISILLLNKNLIEFLYLLVLLVLLLCVFAFILNYFVVKSVTNPLKLLEVASQKVAEGDFDICITQNNNDEIGQLTKNFNSMVKTLESTMKEKVAATESESAYKLKFLEAQINPHFLYNTLDEMRFRAFNLNQTELAKDIGKLSFMFKEMLSLNSDIELEKEINYIRNYIYLVNKSYENIHLHLNKTIDIEGIVIPKFTIQPIVENCIQHGYIHSKEAFIITIDIEMENENIMKITVSDNGIGCADYDLTASVLNQKHIGLKNIHQRLLQRFGEPYGLEFSSIESKGTIVVERIRLRREIP
jgi:two-component system sensor histidine kinase YesM